MYLANQETLPKPPGTPKDSKSKWRLHFEYRLESRADAERHAAVCVSRKLPITTDDDGRTVRRRQTVAVLNLSNEQREELTRFSATTTCSWTDTFDKETGRSEALRQLTTRLKTEAQERDDRAEGAGDSGASMPWPSKDEGHALARGVRSAYVQRPRYKPLTKALELLREAVKETSDQSPLTTDRIRKFLKQFGTEAKPAKPCETATPTPPATP